MLVFTLISILMISTVTPKTAISVSAGAMYGTLWGTLLILVIATTAAWINYWVGRRLLCKRTSEDPVNDHDSWHTALREMAADANIGVHLLVRLSPIPTMVIGYSMGAFQAKPKPYLAAAMLAVFPQAVWVHSGSSAILLGTPYESNLAWLSTLVSIGVAATMSILGPREAMKRIRNRTSHPRSPSHPRAPSHPTPSQPTTEPRLP